MVCTVERFVADSGVNLGAGASGGSYALPVQSLVTPWLRGSRYLIAIIISNISSICIVMILFVIIQKF